MRAYVLGAGASCPIYPLGGTLLNAIDEHIQSCGRCRNRFDYQADWSKLKEWLATMPIRYYARRTGTGTLNRFLQFSIWRKG